MNVFSLIETINYIFVLFITGGIPSARRGTMKHSAFISNALKRQWPMAKIMSVINTGAFFADYTKVPKWIAVPLGVWLQEGGGQSVNFMLHVHGKQGLKFYVTTFQ